jgi:hypothetical protein
MISAQVLRVQTMNILMMVLVFDLFVWTEPEEIVRLDRNKIRKKIEAGQSQVLDDHVELGVGVLDTRDRNIADLIPGG